MGSPKKTKLDSGKYRVFVSLSSQDLDDWKAIEERLTKEHITVWCYVDNIVPSEEFAASITQHIEEADVFLMLLSQHSNESAEVRKEVRLAADLHRRFLVFRLGNFELHRSLKYELATVEFVNRTTKDRSEELDALVVALIHVPGEGV